MEETKVGPKKLAKKYKNTRHLNSRMTLHPATDPAQPKGTCAHLCVQKSKVSNLRHAALRSSLFSSKTAMHATDTYMPRNTASRKNSVASYQSCSQGHCPCLLLLQVSPHVDTIVSENQPGHFGSKEHTAIQPTLEKSM